MKNFIKIHFLILIVFLSPSILSDTLNNQTTLFDIKGLKLDLTITDLLEKGFDLNNNSNCDYYYDWGPDWYKICWFRSFQKEFSTIGGKPVQEIQFELYHNKLSSIQFIFYPTYNHNPVEFQDLYQGLIDKYGDQKGIGDTYLLLNQFMLNKNRYYSRLGTVVSGLGDVDNRIRSEFIDGQWINDKGDYLILYSRKFHWLNNGMDYSDEKLYHALRISNAPADKEIFESIRKEAESVLIKKIQDSYQKRMSDF